MHFTRENYGYRIYESAYRALSADPYEHFLRILFFVHIGKRYFTLGGPHLLWWAIGVLTYGLGTLLESIVTLSGNTPMLNKYTLPVRS